jgi:hypothetical protein
VTCPSPNYSGGQTNNIPWQNWSGHFSGPVNSLFEPDTLPDLVNLIQLASSQGHAIHVMGSGWAFENIAYSADWMINLARLNKQLTAVTDSALNGTWVANQNAGTDVLFHVEAGATIATVNDALCKKGLALATLGGASGQGLAGAISTSTHGGDPSHGPLAEMVMAMHLVTMNGREIWIERASEPITDDFALANALSCPDTEILRNDDVFNALLVGFGRFGVIYSYVLRVQPAFRLNEWTTKIPRIVLTTKLREGLAANTFLTPLLSLLPDPPSTLGVSNIMNPQGLEVVFDTNNLAECYVKRRWLTTDLTDVNMSNSPNTLCVIGAAGVLAAAGAVLAPLAGVPFVGIPIGIELAALSVSLTTNPTMTAGEMLAQVLAAFWTLGLGSSIPLIAGVEFGQQYQGSTTNGIRGASNLVLSGYPSQSLQNCFRADSIEPVFDSQSAMYINFLDIALNSAPQFQQAGYISLRWSGPSKATMSMHNFPSAGAVAIEVTSLKNLPQNAIWMSTVHTVAIGQGGRPHWGQINQMNAAMVSAQYGPALLAWTTTLGALVGSAGIFSNAYTTQRGLEPPASAANPTIFGQRAGDLMMGGFLPAIHLLLSEDNPPPPKPRPRPRPIKPVPHM